MKRDACTWVKALISAAAVTFLLTAGWSQNAPRLILLPPLPGFDSSEALSVSANSTNGLIVVGNSFKDRRQQQRAVYWKIAENNDGVFEVFAQPLDSPDQNDFSAAFDVSANGEFAVGFVRTDVWTDLGPRAVLRAVRWTVGSTRTVLPVPPNTGNNAAAFAISAAGNVVAGRAGAFTPGNFGAFLGGILDQGSAVRWEDIIQIDELPGIAEADRTAAAAVSDDGSILAGASGTGDDLNDLNLVAVVWEGVNGPRELPSPREPGFRQSTVLDCSPYGTAFVGISFNDRENYIASYWRDRGRQFVQLTSTVPSLARRISGDGSEIVGQIGTSDAGRAYLWRFRNGRVEEIDLNTLVPLPAGVTLETAFGISPNGRFIVGRARQVLVVIRPDGRRIIRVRRFGFLLDRRCPLNADVNRDGVVDDADLLQVLFAFGGRGYTNEDTNWDGIVDDADLLEVLLHFGDTCPPFP